MIQLPNISCFHCKRVIVRSFAKPKERVADAQGKNMKCPWCKQHMAPRQSKRSAREKRK